METTNIVPALILNARTEAIVASAVEVAATRASRRRGLLGRDAFDACAALILSPCWTIHTAFMRFPIDVAFVGRDGRVVQVAEDLPPWRVAAAPSASVVIELAAGVLRARDVKVGDQLYLSTPAGRRLGPLCDPGDARAKMIA
ncbi:MAG: DUF192 domain-containing protein [Acidobacteriia bacterium]|nr:DUF192 domain-containing protein [Terriglobia bacterium]